MVHTTGFPEPSMARSRNGVEAKMLVRDRATHDVRVVSLPADMKRRWHFLEERMRIWIANGFSKANLFGVDIASSGSDITSLQAFKEADVIHLHWVNQGMLSLDGLRAILGSGKPVVWTMHDMWAEAAPSTITPRVSANSGYFSASSRLASMR